jgi:phosphoenolpyruvate carboxykinase (GTP)
VERARGRALGKEAAVGSQPRYEDINWDGLDFPKEKFEELQRLDRTARRREVFWA